MHAYMYVFSLTECSDVYNSLTIHGLTSTELLPSSVLGVEQFWGRTAYIIGGLVYSLDHIEHGVLRGGLITIVTVVTSPLLL